MNFLGCDGTWTLGAAGDIGCAGELRSFTVEELKSEVSPASLTIEDADDLLMLTLPVFVAVFTVLVIKKVL
ncbi:hypothetical protein [Stutzerimonas nitrititolerans]|uniref:hypothetical protein n=1 Tax=Stutzerimonas nitrititolerans TaxID=2482751 RepID=UPI00289D6C2A|nr:hypothetical protein [Stutzerimonas nitrititolerans]